jgi:hypothetical protein
MKHPRRSSLVTRGSRFYEIICVHREYRQNYLYPREYRKSDPSLSIRGPTHIRTGSIEWKDWKMTKFKLLAVSAILSMAVATPGIAQQAVQEPGAQAFYQSLGVGSHDNGPTSAMASVHGDSYAAMPAKHILAKPRVKHHSR